MSYTITGTITQKFVVTKIDLAVTLHRVIDELLGHEIDDAACDWLTDGDKVYIGGDDWFVCERADVARLVDAINVLVYEQPLHAENEDPLPWEREVA